MTTIENMARKKRWNELSLRTRRLIIGAATIEGVLKIAAMTDLVRRPADEIRGSKAKWALAILVVNSAGAPTHLLLPTRAKRICPLGARRTGDLGRRSNEIWGRSC